LTDSAKRDSAQQESAKRSVLLFLGLAIVTTLLIGMALPRLTLQPGMPMPEVSGGEIEFTSPAEDLPVRLSINRFVLILFLALLAVGLIILAYRLVRDTNWREILAALGRLVLVLLVVDGLLYVVMLLLPSSQVSLPEPMPLPAKPAAVGPPLGPTPQVLIWLVAAALLVGTVLLGLAVLREKRCSPLAAWQLEAEQARLDLLAGADLKEVILRCYRRMSDALQEEQDIVREDHMTTGEFERLLASKGVPPDPVHQLTRLFDAVRYGQWKPQAGDENRAIQCLDDILAYSRSAPKER
jgi:hypothetical protein